MNFRIEMNDPTVYEAARIVASMFVEYIEDLKRGKV